MSIDAPEHLRPETNAAIHAHLKEFKLGGAVPNSIEPTPQLDLPSLRGKNLGEHFETLGTELAEPYLSLAKAFRSIDLPPMPIRWKRVEGWLRYNPDGTHTRVECPPEQALVFDVEVCVREGNYPTLAIAASMNAWYGWVSRRLAHFDEDAPPLDQDYGINHYTRGLGDIEDLGDEDFEGANPEGMHRTSLSGSEELIPLEPYPRNNGAAPRPKLVVGHSVGYDRARVLEQYHLRKPSTRFLDTMSLHMSTSGLSTQQVGSWRGNNARASKGDVDDDDDESGGGGGGGGDDDDDDDDSHHEEDITMLGDEEVTRMDSGPPSLGPWTQHSSPPSLAHCYKLWYGDDLHKDSRDVFVHGTMDDISRSPSFVVLVESRGCQMMPRALSSTAAPSLLSAFELLCCLVLGRQRLSRV